MRTDAADDDPTPVRATLGAELALLRLASPGLPVGAFSYSRGLEPAVAAGWVHDEASAASFVLGTLEHSVCALDGALLVRLYHAWSAGDDAEVRRLTEYLRAFRESSELLLEDEQMGLALGRLLRAQGVAGADLKASGMPPSYTCMFALAAVRWGIGLEQAVGGFFWAVCESQVSAALRLLPLGQTAGQRMLERAIAVIERCVPRALATPDDQIGNVAPGLALPSAQHELQYSRLFRS
ncbi:MAG: urease accessory protein UreF [Polyangiales bacterium]